MTTPSISQTEKPIDENTRTAIFYSISDIGEYIVEIRFQNQQYYIMQNNNPQRFGNLGEAKIAALDHNAKHGYLALNNTYEETEVRDEVSKKHNAFEYVAVELAP